MAGGHKQRRTCAAAWIIVVSESGVPRKGCVSPRSRSRCAPSRSSGALAIAAEHENLGRVLRLDA